MDLAGAPAVGGGGDDVLRGGRLAGGLLVQVVALVLGCGLRGRLLRLQLRLTLGDDVMRLTAGEEDVKIPNQDFRQKDGLIYQFAKNS